MKKELTMEKGFTLVELLLYMGIFSILLTVLFQIFTSILSLHSESQATSSVDQDGNYILSRISYDIHKSPTASLPSSPCTATPSSTTCVLTLSGSTYSLDSSGNLLLTTGGTSYHLNSAETTIKTITFTTLANAVSAIDPTPKTSVKIDMTLKSITKRPGLGQQQEEFITTVATR